MGLNLGKVAAVTAMPALTLPMLASSALKGGGGTKTATTTSSSSSAPWEVQQPYLQQLFAGAQKQFEGPGPQFYSGPMTAAPTADTTAGQDYIRRFATTQAPAVVGQSSDALSAMLNAYNVGNNPHVNSAIQAAINPVVRSFNESVVPVIRQNAIASGGYGDSRMGVAEGIASDRLQQNLLDTTAKMSLGAYNTGLQATGQGLSLAPTVMQTGAAPGVMLDTVGQAERAYQQALINDAMSKWNFEQTQPLTKLADYQALITGNFGGTTTGTSTAPLAQKNPLMGALGGAASGAAVGSIFPGYGTVIGAGVGGLIGLLGS